MLAIQFYDVVLSVHIMAVVVALGATFAMPFLAMSADKAEPAGRVAIHRAEMAIERAASAGLLVILAAGAYLASDRSYWSETWVTVPLVILVVLGGVSGGVLLPRRRRLAELAQAGGGGEYDSLSASTGRIGMGLGALVLIAIFFMTVQPFA